MNVSIKEKNKCDGVLHCGGGEDEAGCPEEATDKCEGFYCDNDYKQPADGHCKKEDDLICTARDGRYAGNKICLEKKFLCDNHVQCEDGKDEEECEKEYVKKRIFTTDHKYICKSPYLEVRNEDNKTGRFFPIRAVRSISVIMSNIKR